MGKMEAQACFKGKNINELYGAIMAAMAIPEPEDFNRELLKTEPAPKTEEPPNIEGFIGLIVIVVVIVWLVSMCN
jgi:hypothetical protein